ncbi:hypothetical protein AB0001_004783 [Salmonella enterica]|nr:hypothetical protein [Salmonella enterica]EEP3373019.1 hypothetical protein [Salmonella enterica]EFP6579726.1 hypothetical protein [Salmonella enterica]EGC7971009.1 hypothetical protein [Salmonella enterica]EIV4461186.1 hypothetical protein [Salmonella enterica]
MMIFEKKVNKGNKVISLYINELSHDDGYEAIFKVLGRTNPPGGGVRERYTMYEKAVKVKLLNELIYLHWNEIEKNRALQGVSDIFKSLCLEVQK